MAGRIGSIQQSATARPMASSPSTTKPIAPASISASAVGTKRRGMRKDCSARRSRVCVGSVHPLHIGRVSGAPRSQIFRAISAGGNRFPSAGPLKRNRPYTFLGSPTHSTATPPIACASLAIYCLASASDAQCLVAGSLWTGTSLPGGAPTKAATKPGLSQGISIHARLPRMNSTHVCAFSQG
jgi:hypothetical protein